MTLPISRQLARQLIIPFLAITAVPIFDFFKNEDQGLDQNITFLIVFGIPTIILSWTLLDKRAQFKEVKKVPSTQRLIQLPFSSFKLFIVFIISSFAIVGGLATIVGDKDLKGGLFMFLLGTTVFVLTAVAHDHPKIWFSDSHNLDEDIERIKNTPKENFPAYQDGIFSYTGNGFTVKLENTTKTVSWEEIELIKAYKIDQYTVDSIIIEIHLKDTFISINDDTPGLMKFMDNAADKLLNFKKDWFGIVAFPAFATNLTTIYEKTKRE